MTIGLGFELLRRPVTYGTMTIIRVLADLVRGHRLVARQLTIPLVSWRGAWGWLDLPHRLVILLGATASRSTDWWRSHVLLLLQLLLTLLGVWRRCRAGLRWGRGEILSLLAEVHA